MKIRSRINSNKRRHYGVLMVALVIIILGVWLPRLVSVVSQAVMAPVHAVNIWLNGSTSLVPVFIRSRVDLKEEIEGLEHELAVLGRTDLTKQRLWEENNRLRNLLSNAGEERIMAAIIARPNELPYDLLQIDQGFSNGIVVGAPVFIGKDIVIGLVVHVADDYAFVQLVTTPDFSSSVFISGPNVVVTMEGMGGGVARVLVPQGIPLAVGNLVYLPSVEPGVFGRISHVENSPTQPEQFGYISPDIAIASLHQVAVGQRSQITRSVAEIDAKIIEQIKQELLISGLTIGNTASTTDPIATSSAQ